MDLAVEAFRKSQHLIVWRSQVLTLKLYSKQTTDVRHLGSSQRRICTTNEDIIKP